MLGHYIYVSAKHKRVLGKSRLSLHKETHDSVVICLPCRYLCTSAVVHKSIPSVDKFS